MRLLQNARLYTFLDAAYFDGRDPRKIAEELCEGGSDIIQLRAKEKSIREIRAMAEQILPITNSADVPLVINDHLQLAEELGTWCHLGQEDYFDAGIQAPAAPFGLSTHAPLQAERALKINPSYIAIGPVYATGTKPTAKPVTLDYVRWAAANVKIPWFAIGGINLGNLDEVIAAGARRICVVSAILNATDIAGACRAIKKRLPAID